MTLDELKQAVQSLRPDAVATSNNEPNSLTASPDWKATVDQDGHAAIALWNPELGSQPTAEQLAAALADSDLHAARKNQSERIAAAYQQVKSQSSVPVTAGSSTLSFPIDDRTLMDLLAYLGEFTATSAPARMPLEDAFGNMQMLTYAQIRVVAQVVAQKWMAAYTKYMTLQAQIDAAITTAAIQAITWR